MQKIDIISSLNIGSDLLAKSFEFGLLFMAKF